MWIRSQNNDYLVNTNYFEIEGCANSPVFDIDARVGDKWVTLGTYSTKEKALKVLNDIEDTLYCLHGFYHMPKDDEVKCE
jgi:hypothetical protein